MTKKLPVLLALLALVSSSLACALGGEPTLSNTRTSIDSDGVNTTSTFSTFDTVYVVNDVSNGVSGNVVSSNWYAENVEGLDPNFLIDTVEYTIEDESYNGIVYFYFEPPDGGWPVGTYRVEVAFNGTPAATVSFIVQ